MYSKAIRNSIFIESLNFKIHGDAHQTRMKNYHLFFRFAEILNDQQVPNCSTPL